MGRRSTKLRLTNRDLDLLSTLSLRIRLASFEQCVRIWWPDGDGSAGRRLRLLVSEGLLAKRHATAIRLAPVSRPLVAWSPGQPTPDLGRLSWVLAKRWSVAPEPMTIYFASRRCAQRFGGTRFGQIPRAFQLSHDLGAAEMFFAFRKLRPAAVRLWVDEDRLAPYRRGEKLPDAILATSPHALPVCVMEWGGLYGKRRLEAFHRDCEVRGLPYQIW